MDQNTLRPDLLPPVVPDIAVWAMTIFAVAAWIFARRIVIRKFPRPRLRLGILIPVATMACWTILQLLGRFLWLSARWHLALAALVAGAAIETTSFLYAHELSLLPSRRKRRILIALRMTALCLLLFVLCQPILVGERTHTFRSRVVVLLDDSASMNVPDRYWTDEERLDVAQALGLVEGSESDNAGAALAAALPELAKSADMLSAFEPAGLPREETAKLAADLDALLVPAADSLDAAVTKLDQRLHAEAASTIPRVASFIREQLAPTARELAAAVEPDKTPDAATTALIAKISSGLSQLAPVSATIRDAASLARFDTMDDAARTELTVSTEIPRAEIARRLFSGNAAGAALLDGIAADHDIDFYRFGATAENESRDSMLAPRKSGDEADAVREKSFRSSTDITRAIENAIREIPFEELAGFLVISDGRHNGDAGVDAVTRRLGSSNIPVHSLLVGGTRPPVDLALAEARAPESVFDGDKIRIAGTLVATGARGKEAHVRLLLDDEVVGEATQYIETDDFSHEFKFTDVAEGEGVRTYKLVVDQIENEEFPDNNEWTLDVAVTEDRTNVLLVDDYPRWEFRYLRNLFYGRDKSVHLQELLFHPDVVNGQPPADLPPASASRKFGDSESGSLPVSRAEWRKFDVIIIGDLGEDTLTPKVVEELRYCVEDRGAMLVFIDGPRAFPHAIRSQALKDLMPVEYEESDGPLFDAPESDFHMRLAPSGRGHPTMQQSSSSFENEQIWNDLPTLGWRHPVLGVKPGAEVLAWAESTDSAEAGDIARLAARDVDEDPEAAVRRLAEMREQQAANSLIVTRNQGRGKVMQLNTDRTWRLRYRVGDVRHHRFWGQVLRWGAGEKLRAGNMYLRLGTDQLRYVPTDRIRIQARFQDTDFNALDDLSPRAVITDENGRELRSVRLRYREDSNGFYEADTDPIDVPGSYIVRLDCREAERILGDEHPGDVRTRFVVVTARRPAEFVAVSASRSVPDRMAALSGGKVVTPARIGALADCFGDGNRVTRDRTETYLWDRWQVFLLLVAVLTVEWILRKKGSLV